MDNIPDKLTAFDSAQVSPSLSTFFFETSLLLYVLIYLFIYLPIYLFVYFLNLKWCSVAYHGQ